MEPNMRSADSGRRGRNPPSQPNSERPVVQLFKFLSITLKKLKVPPRTLNCRPTGRVIFADVSMSDDGTSFECHEQIIST